MHESERPQPPDLVPVRMLNEYVYCPRLCYLEWVQGEWADNAFTEDGRFVHRRADREQGAVPDPDLVERPFEARSVALSSERLGLTTRVDVLEGEEGLVVPVDYKRGRAPDVPEGAFLPERVQICAQALVLRDCGYRVEHGELYFAESRERVPVRLTRELIAETEAATAGARALPLRPQPPPPLEDSPKCDGCSLVGICLPDEVNRLVAESDQPRPAMRLLHPARDDALPLYVQLQGAKVGLRRQVLEIRAQGEKLGEARLEHTSQVCVFGNVQVSTQALRRLLERNIPLLVFSSGGWFFGWAHGLGGKNVDIRRAQFRAADDPARSLELARRFVSAKIANQRTLLRRNHPDPGRDVLRQLAELRRSADSAERLDSLLGIEGTAARVYFEHLPAMLKLEAFGSAEFSFSGRNRRPPRDPVNAVLSFLYALLTKDWTIACAAAGLDPYLGFYHQLRHGRPSLALDLLEEFRPLIADSVLLRVINSGTIQARHFVRRGPACALKPPGRRAVLSAYERRMAELVTHPVFGYRISYRRVLEVQARLLGRYLLGEIPSYPSFRPR